MNFEDTLAQIYLMMYENSDNPKVLQQELDELQEYADTRFIQDSVCKRAFLSFVAIYFGYLYTLGYKKGVSLNSFYTLLGKVLMFEIKNPLYLIQAELEGRGSLYLSDESDGLKDRVTDIGIDITNAWDNYEKLNVIHVVSRALMYGAPNIGPFVVFENLFRRHGGHLTDHSMEAKRLYESMSQFMDVHTEESFWGTSMPMKCDTFVQFLWVIYAAKYAESKIRRTELLDEPVIDTEKRIWDTMEKKYGDDMYDLLQYGRKRRAPQHNKGGTNVWTLKFEWYKCEEYLLDFSRAGYLHRDLWQKQAAELGVIGY